MAQRVNKKLRKAFAKTLKQVRKQQDLTQEQVSEAAGLHRTTVAYFEGDKMQPSIDAIFRLSKGLGISPAELVAEVEKNYES